MRKFVHYGDDEFRNYLFDRIGNRWSHNKPYGGLWSSDVNAKRGWKAWCEENDFRISDKSFQFAIKSSAKVLVLDSSEKVKTLPQRTDKKLGPAGETQYFLDFEWIAEDYDVIDFRISEDRTLYYTMYGWDCDTVLVMNPDVVVPLDEEHKESIPVDWIRKYARHNGPEIAEIMGYMIEEYEKETFI